MSLAARLAALLALVLAMTGAAWRIHAKAEAAGYARAQGEHAAQALALTAKLEKDKNDAIQKAAARAQLHRADAAGARSELDRLRNTLTATGPGDSCTTPTDRADPARELFDQCAAALVDLAEKADRHASDALTLHSAWPRPD